MDGTAEEHAHLEEREAQRFSQGGIDHHHHRAEEVDAHHREGEVAVGILVLGQDRRSRHCRRRAADAGGAAGQQAEILAEAEQARCPGAEHDGAADRRHRNHDRQRAALDEIAERQARAQQRDADTEQGAAGEFEAGLQHRPGGKRLQRHADHQRQDQRRHPDGTEAQQAARVGVVGDGGNHRTESDTGSGAAKIVGSPELGEVGGDGAVTHRSRPRAGLRRLPRLR